MIYRVDWNKTKAVIGCGVILTLLGVVAIWPVVAWLINSIGWLLIALGLPNQSQDRIYMVRHREPCGFHFGLNLVVALDVGSLALETHRRD